MRNVTSLVLFLIPFFVIFSNFSLAGSLLLADLFYFLFAVYFIFILLIKRKVILSREFAILNFYFVFVVILNFLKYQNYESLFSQMRFLFGFNIFFIFFIFLKTSDRVECIVKYYLLASLFFSAFVVLQFFTYYALHVNLSVDFGSYSKEVNSASFYDPLSALFYRTGGFFKEPSWYAAYVSPSLAIFYEKREYKKFAIILSGLLFSTSGLAYFIVLLFVLFYFVKKIRIIPLLFFIMGLIVVNLFFPNLFVRFFDVLKTGGSLSIRIIEPFGIAFNIDYFTLLGNNMIMQFENGVYKFFANTFVYIYLAFGVIGIVLFVSFFYFKRNMYFTAMILLIIVVEGLYGRIDFWIMLLSVYSYNAINVKRQSDNVLMEL